jgi:hypothetical protein
MVQLTCRDNALPHLLASVKCARELAEANGITGVAGSLLGFEKGKCHANASGPHVLVHKTPGQTTQKAELQGRSLDLL